MILKLFKLALNLTSKEKKDFMDLSKVFNKSLERDKIFDFF